MKKKIALVTGGTGGIGTAICRRLHEDGFRVVAGYYSGGNHEKAQIWQKAQKENGYDMAISYGNVPDFESCQECVEHIEKNEGPITILVNNAGITRDSVFKKMELFQWVDVINANLNGVRSRRS